MAAGNSGHNWGAVGDMVVDSGNILLVVVEVDRCCSSQPIRLDTPWRRVFECVLTPQLRLRQQRRGKEGSCGQINAWEMMDLVVTSTCAGPLSMQGS